MNLSVAIAATLIPLVVYIVAAVTINKSSINHPDDFFLAYRRAGVTAFSTSSIAYAFQLSTIYPYLNWGYQGTFLVPFVNAVCWAGGIALFAASVSKCNSFMGSDLTLHGFMGSKYGTSVRTVASLLSIAGFLGYMIAELYFGSRVLRSIVGEAGLYYLCLAIIIFLIFGYIAYGGQLSSMRTDQLQLVFSYVGIFGFFIYTLYCIWKNKAAINGPISIGLILAVVYIIVILLFRRFHRFINIQLAPNIIEAESSTMRFIGAGVGTILLVTLISIAVFLISFGVRSGFPSTPQLGGFGIPGLISLIVLPLGWQFVDLTNWQRLLSIRSSYAGSEAPKAAEVRQGLGVYAIESSFTWILFLLFGALMLPAFGSTQFQDLLVDVPARLIYSPLFADRLFGYIFIASILSIMFSTIDSFFIGIIFTFVYDTCSTTKHWLDANRETGSKNLKTILHISRIFGAITAFLGLLCLILFDRSTPNHSGAQAFINVLLAFYSAQLSFLPLVLGILFLKEHPTVGWANASMLAGALPAIGLGIWTLFKNQEYAWFPLIVCVLCSFLVYALGYIFTNFEVPRRFWSVPSNRFVLLITVITILFGVLGTSWERWEVIAIAFTLLYTIWVYVDGFFLRKHLGNIKTENIGVIGLLLLGLLLLGYVTWRVTIEVADVGAHLINRPTIMLCLFMSSLLFCILDGLLAVNGKDYSESYKRLLRYSDLPICVAFFILFLYSLKIEKLPNMDAFFAGAIAFQMIVSNVIWTLTAEFPEANTTEAKENTDALVRIQPEND
jgi:hypothetical protein